MKLHISNQKSAALTPVDVLVVVFVLTVLVAIILPTLTHHSTRKPMLCTENLKQVGISFRVWEGENNDKFPMQVSVTNGGTMELASGRNAWINFFVMSNELSTPKILTCPQDAKHQPPATNFSSQLAGHISYFVNLDMKDSDPQSILSGDANFEIGGVPVKSGLLELSSNTPIAWTPDRHGAGGYIILGDGSLQSLSNSGLTNWLQKTGLATNRLAIP